MQSSKQSKAKKESATGEMEQKQGRELKNKEAGVEATKSSEFRAHAEDVKGAESKAAAAPEQKQQKQKDKSKDKDQKKKDKKGDFGEGKQLESPASPAKGEGASPRKSDKKSKSLKKKDKQVEKLEKGDAGEGKESAERKLRDKPLESPASPAEGEGASPRKSDKKSKSLKKNKDKKGEKMEKGDAGKGKERDLRDLSLESPSKEDDSGSPVEGDASPSQKDRDFKRGSERKSKKAIGSEGQGGKVDEGDASPVSGEDAASGDEGEEYEGEGNKSLIDTAKEKLAAGVQYVKDTASSVMSHVPLIGGGIPVANEAGDAASPKEGEESGDDADEEDEEGEGAGSPREGRRDNQQLEKQGESDEESGDDTTKQLQQRHGMKLRSEDIQNIAKNDPKVNEQHFKKHLGPHADAAGGKEKHIGIPEPNTGGRSHAQAAVGGQRY